MKAGEELRKHTETDYSELIRATTDLNPTANLDKNSSSALESLSMTMERLRLDSTLPKQNLRQPTQEEELEKFT